MKSKFFLTAFIFLCSIQFSFSQSTPAIIADWMSHAGVSDTLTVIPIVQDDSANIISVGVMMNDTTGADILICKTDSAGHDVFKKTFSSAGLNRDQPIAVTVDHRCDIYVAGVVYSSATNFDWIILKYGYDGTLIWTYTLNGTTNNYDAPAALKIKNNFLYVTGTVYDSASQLNYCTLQFQKDNGTLNWKREYDFHSLYDVAFAMDISVGGTVTIAGASQDSLTKWHYCSVNYDSTGLAKDTVRTSGTSNSFDRPMAVKCDKHGNFYITGAGTDSAFSFNARTVKVDSTGNVSWMTDYGTMGKDEEGNDLLVDDSGYVYVCGKAYVDNHTKIDYLLVKYNSSGTEQWHDTLDADGGDDIANKMCFDSYGNIILTGKAKRTTDDFRTLAISKNGDLLWSVYFDGEYGGIDQATGITSDSHGNIFVSGESQITDSTYEKVTIKYKTDYFLVPQDTVPAPSSLLFYPNQGQIIDYDGNLPDHLRAYTINQYPNLFFSTDTVSFVLSHIDKDTTTADSVERIAMNFVGGALDKPYYDGTHEDQLLNYFLAQCPDGITDVAGSEKLMYSNVYENTDVIFSNNKAGMKFQIIMNAFAEPQAILHFTGHQSLQIISNSDLKVNGTLGSFTYERPLVYQLDGSGNRISLGWIASYHIVDSADVSFVLSGSYDNRLPLVIECAHFFSPSAYPHINNLEWSTYFGGSNADIFQDMKVDSLHNVYAIGRTLSIDFPNNTGLQILGNAGDFDAVAVKFDSACGLLWSTYLGGGTPAGGWAAGREWGQAVVPDNQGNVYLFGTTSSVDFPLHYETGAYMDSVNDSWKLYIAKINDNGNQLLWSTFLGDSGNYAPYAWAADYDNLHNLFFVGQGIVTSVPFPGAYNSNSGLGVLAGFDSNDSPFWITHFGNDIYDISVTKTGTFQNRIFITGETGSGGIPLQFPADSSYNGGSIDAFVASFFDNYSLNWSTYWGGSNQEAGYSISVDDTTTNTPNVYAVGSTMSSDFHCHADTTFTHAFMDSSYNGNSPGSADHGDAFILKFNSDGKILYATLYGDSTPDAATSVVANNRKLYVGGYSEGAGLPVPAQQPYYAYASDYKDSITNQYADEGFLAVFNDSMQLVWSTYYGSPKYDWINAIALDESKHKLYIAGQGGEEIPNNPAKDFPWVEYDTTSSADYFLATHYFGVDDDGFIARFDTRAIPSVGIVEPKKDGITFMVYPNPSSNQINVQLELNKVENLSVEMYNSMGQLVNQNAYSNKFGKVNISVDVANFSKGVYLITVRTKDSSSSKVIIVN